MVQTVYAVTPEGALIGPMTAEAVEFPNLWVPDPPPMAPPGMIAVWRFPGWELRPDPHPPAVPEAVTALQFRRALKATRFRQGGQRLFDRVDGAILMSGDEDLIETWEYMHKVERASPLVAALAASMQLDEASVDAVFVHAATL